MRFSHYWWDLNRTGNGRLRDGAWCTRLLEPVVVVGASILAPEVLILDKGQELLVNVLGNGELLNCWFSP